MADHPPLPPELRKSLWQAASRHANIEKLAAEDFSRMCLGLKLDADQLNEAGHMFSAIIVSSVQLGVIIGTCIAATDGYGGAEVREGLKAAGIVWADGFDFERNEVGDGQMD